MPPRAKKLWAMGMWVEPKTCDQSARAPSGDLGGLRTRSARQRYWGENRNHDRIGEGNLELAGR